MSNPNISYQPTDGLSYDPTDAHYWDADALQKEITRVFEVCHGCRMCFKFCDSFPDLFSFIDERHDGDVTQITSQETEHVMDACFQCKLCEVECPYTPRDGHEFLLDFPKLVHRYKAQRQKEQSLSLGDRLLTNPDAAGRLARMSFGLANVMNRTTLHRWFLEQVLDIHRDKELPDFASSTFERWAANEGRVLDAPIEGEQAPEAVLFQTCYVQNNEPQIGRDALDVLDANQIPTTCAKGLGCCGMPSWEKGDLDTLRERARANLDVLEPFVEAGSKVLVINPTCSMTMRREYPQLLEGEDRVRAERLADHIHDVGEYVWSLRKEERFNTNFQSQPAETVAYHAPCHLRAQAVGFKGRDLLRKIPGVRAKTVMECCGHDGTYAMTTQGFEASQRAGRRAFEGMQEADTEIWATDCPLAAIQFKQHAGVKPMHPLSILARAYREDGFPTPIPPPEDT